MKRFLPIVFALLALPTPAVSQISQAYDGTPGSQEYLNFVGASPSVAGTFGVYVGPYTGRFSGDPTSQQFSLFCVDYDHHAGSQWVDVSSLGGDLSNTRLGAGGAATYQRTAYLSSLFDSWEQAAADVGYAGASKKSVWSSLHSAIWTLVRSDIDKPEVDPGVLALDDMRNKFVTAAFANAGSFDASGWYLLSPATGYDGQEFLIRTTSVPEPSTLLLMATGLFFIVVWRRKRTLGLVES